MSTIALKGSQKDARTNNCSRSVKYTTNRLKWKATVRP